jgi:hypothetical protein
VGLSSIGMITRMFIEDAGVVVEDFSFSDVPRNTKGTSSPGFFGHLEQPVDCHRMVGPENTVVWCSGKSAPSLDVPHHHLARRRAVIVLGVGMPACLWRAPCLSRLPSQLFFSSIPPFVVATFNSLPPPPTVPESAFELKLPCTVTGKSV